MNINDIIGGALKAPINRVPLEMPENRIDASLVVYRALNSFSVQHSTTRILNAMSDERVVFSKAEKQAVELIIRMISRNEDTPKLGLKTIIDSYTRIIRESDTVTTGEYITIDAYYVVGPSNESDALLGSYGLEVAYSTTLLIQALLRAKYKTINHTR